MWSQTATNNATADSTIYWAEGQAPSTVNNSARGMMAATAKFRDDIGGIATTTGTSTAYVLTSNQGFTSLTNGLICGFYLHTMCGATVTLNVDGLGAKPLRAIQGVELYQGQVLPGIYSATYLTANGEWILHEVPCATGNGKISKNFVGRNGGLEVWQRGTSIAVAASTVAYTADGFYLKTGTGQASVVSRVTGLTNNSVYGAQIQRNSGQNGTGTMYWAMPLDTDELYKLRGFTVALSFTAQAGGNWSPTGGSLNVVLYCGTGSVGKRGAASYTGETTPINTVVNLTGSAVQSVFISGSIASNVTQAELQFNWVPVGTAGTNDWFQIDDIQLEIVPPGITFWNTVFDRTDHLQDLTRCQRHYYTTYDEGTAPGTVTANGANVTLLNGSGSGWLTVPFTVPMRTVPTITLYNSTTGAAGTWRDGGGSDDSVTGSRTGLRSTTVSGSGSASTTLSGHVVADASI